MKIGPDDEEDTPLLDEVITACIMSGSNTEVGVWEVDAQQLLDNLGEE